MGKVIDLTGKHFGMLTVLYRADNKNGRTFWHCKCDCGNEKDIAANHLSRFETLSCGCLSVQTTSKRNSTDKTGQRFGMLIAKERLPNYKNGRTYYLCDCDCGNETIVLGSNLRKIGGHTSSCGCQSSRLGTRQYDFLHQYRLDDGKKIYLIYKHTSPNGKSYIGMTKQSVMRRSQNGNGYSTQRLFYNAIKKYGWNNFKHEILEENLTHDEACEREQYYISYFKSNIRKYGYNITSGGDGCNHRGKHVIQKYNNTVVNCFKSYAEAANLLGFSSPTSIGNFCKNKTNIGGYTFENISFDEYEKYKNIFNKKHLNIKNIRMNDLSKSRRESDQENCKNINQYDLDGKYINTFIGVNKASELLNISNISYAIRHNASAGGYQWRYDNGDHSDIPKYHCNGKIVLQYDKNFTYISQFQSMIEAEKCTGVGFRQIWKVCNGKNKTAGGFIWRYADEVKNNTLEMVI